MLIPDYYKITDSRPENGAIVFDIDINPDCRVYQGHFPEEPICPGVCNIQMIKECAETICGKELRLLNLSQCRLTSLMKPDLHGKVNVRMEISREALPYKFKASLYAGETVFMEMKGELSE